MNSKLSMATHDDCSLSSNDHNNVKANEWINKWFQKQYRGAAKKTALKRPARVEPKSFFANERTFIQWISAALLLVTISVLLLSFSSEDSTSSASYTVASAGAALNLAAAMIVAYAWFVYYRRIKLLQGGSPYGYIDHFGPLVLAVAVFTGILVLMFYFFHSGRVDWSNNKGLSVLHEEYGKCYQHTLEGVNRLKDQPSDVLLDSERQVLLIPSLSEIWAIPTQNQQEANGDATPKIVASIPNADIEGLTYGHDKILYAISELGKAGETELIALQWDTSNHLEVVGRWIVQTLKGEGIAYVPGANATHGKLFIGGDSSSSTVSAEIHAYDEPLFHKVGEKLSGQVINGRLIAEGLMNAKIAALHYFEGVLYVLHDNERMVRAWDIEKGILHSQWSLPMVGNGYDKMWEGMALERKSKAATNLRSGTSGSLVLYLALDTPAEVWSFAVEKGETPGSIILPSCAAAYT
jgi:uncharacterized membrane protein YidH (DUF202 family)